MTRVCATAAMQLAPNVISRHKSVARSFGLVPFPRAHQYTSITKREVISFGTRKEIRASCHLSCFVSDALLYIVHID